VRVKGAVSPGIIGVTRTFENVRTIRLIKLIDK